MQSAVEGENTWVRTYRRAAWVISGLVFIFVWTAKIHVAVLPYVWLAALSRKTECFYVSFLSLISYCRYGGEINLNQKHIVLCWMLLKNMREDVKAEQFPFFDHVKYIFNTVLYLFHLHTLFWMGWQMAFSQGEDDLLDCSQVTDRHIVYIWI